MAHPIGTGRPASTRRRVCTRITMAELLSLPVDSPILDTVLPDWVTQAHLRHLETGKGDPWGGFFASRRRTPARMRL